MPVSSFLFLQWILQNKDKFGFRYRQKIWSEKHLLPGLHDYVCFLQKDGRRFIGLGASYDPRLALIKATAECIERALLVELELGNSNGVALHSNLKSAIENSRLELVERDAFLCHFLTRTPFQKMTRLPEKLFGTPVENIFRRYKQKSYEIDFFRMEGHTRLHKIIAIARSEKRPGLIIGSSCQFQLHKACEHALIESSRFIDSIEMKPGNFFPMSVKKFSKLKTFTVEDHFRLGCDEKYADWFYNNFCQSTAPLKVPSFSATDFNKIKVRTFSLKKTSFADAPLYLTRAKDTRFQDLYFGPAKNRDLNRPRLKKFNPSARIEIGMPHPYA